MSHPNWKRQQPGRAASGFQKFGEDYIILPVKLLLFSALMAICVPLTAQTPSTADYVLRDVRLIDGTGRPPIEHAAIVIRNGKIAVVTTGNTNVTSAHNLNLSGKTVIPGIINARAMASRQSCRWA